MTPTSADDEALTALRAYRASNRDPDLLARLMAAYDGLARHIARRYHIPGFDLEDLEQEARLGLMNALNRYDPDGLHRGRKFPSVAVFAMRTHLRRVTGLDVDIADEDTVPMMAIARLQPPAWMQSRITRELPALTLDIPDPAPSVEEIVLARVGGAELSARLEAALVLLTSRERAILARRYGLGVYGGDGCVQTMEAISQALGIHKSNVCRGEKRALGKLRAELARSADGVAALRELHERARGNKERRRAIRAA